MFEKLAKFRIILVSGPQRSGTRIAARMIAADTGHCYIDEHEYGVHDVECWAALVEHYNNAVVHCPSMSHLLDWAATDEILVVFMLRDLTDIRASEIRVNWTIGVYQELYNYGFRLENGDNNELGARRYRKHGGQIAPLKYAYWWGAQRARCPHVLEVKYESLSNHELWIPKHERADFAAEQTSGP